VCLQLPNSGDTLKLMIPSINRKVNSGQINSLGMVTSHKMMETEMGNRGSKSGSFGLPEPVKEQRVDGSYLGSIRDPKLRCTLTGGESRYQAKIPSNRFVKNSLLSTFALDSKNQACLAAIAAYKREARGVKFFSTHSQCKNLVAQVDFRSTSATQTSPNLSIDSYQLIKEGSNSSILPDLSSQKTKTITGKSNVDINKLNPWFVTGFTDAEGCFGLYLNKNTKYKTGWSVNLVFKISLHEKEKVLLEQIQNYFGVGKITRHDLTSLSYWVRSSKDMQTIINHFEKFPLITSKLKDYKLFKLATNLILQQEQLSLEGIKRLIEIKSSMNLGLSPELKAHFPSGSQGSNKTNFTELLCNETKTTISDYKIPNPN